MIAPWHALLAAWRRLDLLTQVAFSAWVLATISLPLVPRLLGDRGMRWGVTSGVVLQAATVVAALSSSWGWARTVLVASAIAGMGWAVEYLGSHTGFPFGRYHYTGRLQPQLGHVPLAIPLAWLMMLPPAWAVAEAIAGGHRLAFVAVSALAFTVWDLFLDPQMVALGLWVWERRGGYFGIPWVNYLGWALASGLMTAVIPPRSLPATPLLLIYGLTWTLETVGLGLLWRQPGPAACGFAGMGGMLLWTWLSQG